MGVNLPDFASVGFRDPQAGGAPPVFPAEDPGAQGLAVLGKGVQAAGGALEDVAADAQRKKDKLEEAIATVDLFNRLTPLHAQIAKETDPAKLGELRGQYDTLLQTSNAGISNPLRRQMWTATHSKTIAQAQADADTRNTGLGREQATADIWRQRDDAVRNAVASDDPMAIPNAQMAIDGLGKYASDYGALDPKQKYLFDKQSQNQLYEGRADRLIQQGKADEAASFLEANRDKIDPVALERLQIRATNLADTIGVSAAADRALGLTPKLPPRSSGLPGAGPDKVDNWETQHNNFGGMRKVGVPAAGPNAGGFQEFDTPEAGVAAISHQLDRYASGATTGKSLTTIRQIVSTWAPASENPTAALIARASKIVGVDPDAQLNLADPDVKAKLIEATIRNEQGGKLPVNPAIITAVAGAAPPPAELQANVDTGTPNRSGLPSLMDAWQNIQSDPALKNDRQRYQAFEQAKGKYNAFEATLAQQERVKTQREQQGMKDAENQVWQDVYSAQPKITPAQVATDPRFNVDPSRRKQMVELINNPPGSGIPAAQSYAAAQAVLDRIRLPEGNENKITDRNQIYDQMRSMNKDDLNFALTKFDELSSPGEHKFGQRLETFFREITPQIDRSGALPGLPSDSRGKAKSYEYRRFVEDQVDQARKAGKNPDDLINPKNSAYLGAAETLKPYKRTIKEALEDFSTDMNVGGLNTEKPAVSAVEITATGPGGSQIALRNGQWVDIKTGNALPPANVSVPIR